eukprot:SAG11_NODE_1933_length_4040_cov_12.707435_4_plen_142_part_01
MPQTPVTAPLVLPLVVMGNDTIRVALVRHPKNINDTTALCKTITMIRPGQGATIIQRPGQYNNYDPARTEDYNCTTTSINGALQSYYGPNGALQAYYGPNGAPQSNYGPNGAPQSYYGPNGALQAYDGPNGELQPYYDRNGA